MQVTEVSAEGLKRAYKVVVSASEIAERVDGRLAEIQKQAKMPGFRPGKVPLGLLKKQYGRSVLGEVVEQTVNAGSQKAIEEHNLKPALRPKIELTSFDEGQDLEFSMDVEVLPELPQVDLKAIQIDKPFTKVADDELEKALHEFRHSQAEWLVPEPARASQDGDRLTIDFVGKVDGEPFEGGAAEGFKLVLGKGMMIPGFEDGLVGVEAGADTVVEVTFPEDYGNQQLAGKAATFDVKVHQVEAPKLPEVDAAFAEKLGFENLEDLRSAFRSRLQERYDDTSRFRAKRALLDALAAAHDFEVPPGMVDLEFEAIWKQLTDEMERTGQTFEQAGKTEDETKTEYRNIANRRVRLGLLLSEIGRSNEIQVTPEELARAVASQARRYPGKEREVFEFFQQNAEAREQLRAPLFEDKVVDFILQIAQVTTKEVSPEELMRDPDDAAENQGDTAAT
ncbi:MAG: trigger factor [Geminicoccaceae bacterium]|nr:MAG: trigger factor [Geminicoccaceae bacterium]